MNNYQRKLNRRCFIQRCLQGSLGAATAFSGVASLRSMQALAADTGGEYRALVCVFLFGGNDSYNMLIPAGAREYQQYQQARQLMAVPQADLLAIESLAGQAYGLHPAMPELQQLYQQGRAGLVANIGALLEPVSRASYDNGSSNLPPRLFSHNDQQSFIQKLRAGGGASSGWAGRMADLLQQPSAALASNITLAGSNIWQVGAETLPYSISPGGVNSVRFLDSSSSNPRERARTAVFNKVLSTDSGHLFGREFAAIQQRSIATGELIDQALSAQAQLTTVFPASGLGSSLSMVAQMIQARAAFGLNRQVFFVAAGGWDTHGSQLQNHPLLLADLSQSLAAFYRATQELGLQSNVTTFTASDFGRTLTTNGDGSDHGWGGNQLVMGGSVRGGDIYGNYPDLTVNGDNDAGRGRMIPGTGVDQMAATLAQWYGNFSAGELHELLPQLSNFSQANLGFMA